MGQAEATRSGESLLTSAVRRRIVDSLAALPRLAVEGRPTRDVGLTAAELGEVLDLHSTTVRFHLDQLVAAGLVDAHFVRDGGAGRPKKKYVVVDGGLELLAGAQGAVGGGPDAPGTAVARAAALAPDSYQVLASLLVQALNPDSGDRRTPEEAGAEWVRQRLADLPEPVGPARSLGEWLSRIGEIVDLLQEWGYTPDLAVNGAAGDVQLVLRDCPFLELARSHPSVVCGVHRGLLKGALEAAGETEADVSLRPFVDARTCHALVIRDATGREVRGLQLPGDDPSPPRSATQDGSTPAPAPPARPHDIPDPAPDPQTPTDQESTP